jgi:lipopolysaccharide/colanic/teichoic acid biosynthesis glycosyltransferase
MKRAMDICAVLVLLTALAPLLIVIIALIWLDDGRPIFFSQIRAGQYGTPFRIYKFRTLLPESPDVVEPEHATRIGRLLRRWALDELPQLWNVLKGEMSLVGPRPILPEEASYYTPRQQQRLTVPPGLTGWAQIHGRNELPWHERIEHDLWYVRHQSLWLDLRIMLSTPGALLSGDGVYGPGNHDPSAEDLSAHRMQSVKSKG